MLELVKTLIPNTKFSIKAKFKYTTFLLSSIPETLNKDSILKKSLLKKGTLKSKSFKKGKKINNKID